MAKVSAHGTELLRYFSTTRFRLFSLRSDGTVLAKSTYSNGWKLYARKKASVSMEDWEAAHRRQRAKQPAWAQVCTSIPSLRQLEEWASEAGCGTPTGEYVEHDGAGADGAPSWLRALGMI